MRRKDEIREWKTKRIIQELERADSDFWAWQADGLKPGYDCENYAEELAEELRNRGLDY